MESFWEFVQDTFMLFGKVLLYLLVFRAAVYLVGYKIYVPVLDPTIGWLIYKLTGTAQIGPWSSF